jgi:threonine aldolase
VEQTHNRAGGAVHSLVALQELREMTAAHSVALHCDGARIWNAAVATATPLSDYGRLFDTMSVCLSKGLGAPIGSLVVTDATRAAEARTLRKRLGGGLRQVGVIAAAGVYALDHHLDRLAEDHERARVIGAAVGVVPETNIVPIDLTSSAYDGPALASAARDEGVLVSVVGPRKVRLVTHLDIDDAAARRAAEVMAKLVGV